MIPKIIHYCWLSDEPIPSNLQNYIDGWKKLMPDYAFKRWDKKAFDIHSVKWVEDAYANRKWAFAADYIRAYALYTEGGFYLDSDVLLQQRLDDYLDAGFVSSIECNPKGKKGVSNSIDSSFHRKDEVPYISGFGIQAAIIGSEKEHPFPKELLSYYHSHQFMKNDGSLDQLPAPIIYSLMLEKKGFLYKDEYQELPNRMKIYDSKVFASFQTCNFKSVGIHVCAASWVDVKKRCGLVSKLKKNLLIRKIYNTIF